ncbi:MAG: hypothetical protein SPJ01_05515 [Butyricicoccus sp.]|nr:hypothetical protein [Clostridiales bacterium]MDY5972314.1 hypothetical protein [Butyricicoccus sp.]
MRLCLNTDGLGHLPFEEMVKTSAAIGVESLEIEDKTMPALTAIKKSIAFLHEVMPRDFAE